MDFAGSGGCEGMEESPKVKSRSFPPVTWLKLALRQRFSRPAQIRTGVMGLIPLAFSPSKSTSAIRSPAFTESPAFTWQRKYSPFSPVTDIVLS